MGTTSHSSDPLQLIKPQRSLSSLPSLNKEQGSSITDHHHCITTLRGHTSYISALAVDQNSLYSGSADQHIRTWTSELNPQPNHTAATYCKSPVKSLLVSGDTIFSSHQDHKIRIWHNKHNQNQPCTLQASLPTTKDRILSFVSPNKHIEVRRHKTCTWVHHVDAVSAMAISGDRSLLYSVSWDRTIKIWRLSDLKCIESVAKAHHDAINTIAVSRDGFIYTGSADTTIRVWKQHMGQKKHTLVDTLERHQSAVNALALSSDGAVLYSGACDRSIVVWELKVDGRGVAVGGLRGHNGAVLCLSVTGDLVFSGSADKTVRVWRRGRGGGGGYSCLGVFEGHGGPVKSLAMGRRDDECNACLVFSGSLDSEIKVWEFLIPCS